MSEFFNLPILESFSAQGFNKTKPFPNHLFKEILLSEAFNELYNHFPCLDLFEKYVNEAWHVGETGSEVSPHCDSLDKIGTHIFYFNTSADWEVEWGGSILALGGARTAKTNPDISDFETVESFDIRDNSSFLFKNTADGWHATEVLTCPPNHYRRLFNVIVQKRKTEKTLKKLWHYLSGKN